MKARSLHNQLRFGGRIIIDPSRISLPKEPIELFQRSRPSSQDLIGWDIVTALGYAQANSLQLQFNAIDKRLYEPNLKTPAFGDAHKLAIFVRREDSLNTNRLIDIYRLSQPNFDSFDSLKIRTMRW